MQQLLAASEAQPAAASLGGLSAILTSATLNRHALGFGLWFLFWGLLFCFGVCCFGLWAFDFFLGFAALSFCFCFCFGVFCFGLWFWFLFWGFLLWALGFCFCFGVCCFLSINPACSDFIAHARDACSRQDTVSLALGAASAVASSSPVEAPRPSPASSSSAFGAAKFAADAAAAAAAEAAAKQVKGPAGSFYA